VKSGKKVFNRSEIFIHKISRNDNFSTEKKLWGDEKVNNGTQFFD